MLRLHRSAVWVLVAWAAAASAQGPPPGYYDPVDDSTPATLRQTLHEVIDDHTRFPYTSSAPDTWDILELAEEDPADAGRILDVYRNASFAKQGGGNPFYNREHTWPKSYGFPDDGWDNYPYSDCYQLRLCDDGYNSSRSNKPFRICSASCSEKPTDPNDGQGGGTGIYPGNSNWTSGAFTQGTWETWIGKRGDVARAMFYLDVRYEGGSHGITGASEPDLILTDSEALIDASNTGQNEPVAYMGILSVLLQWHLEDPVDDRERARNDVVYSFQGNRNPFIDHPEWVACLFEGNCDGAGGGGGSASSDPWINELHYDNSGSDTGEFVELAGPAGLALSGWKVVLYNGNGGGTYATIALSGVIPDQGSCFGTLGFLYAGIQNGSPDGLSLVDPAGAVVQWLSYEGVMTATDGPAAGMTSVDMGVSESGTTPVGTSLQLGGNGGAYADFVWQGGQPDTFGQPNAGQSFSAAGIISYGVGTMGSMGMPTLCAHGPASVGETLEVLVGNVPPATTVYIALSLAPSVPPLDLSNGLLINVAMPVLFLDTLTADAAGFVPWPLLLPPQAAGLSLFFQAAALDGVGGDAFASSLGLQVDVP
ncbi:MAG: endonuclease [Planctomycetota bacterium]|nr:endonuclease [Planctomycetota bacterium]